MVFFTRKGDKGTTKLLKTKKGERISKSSAIFDALGSMDEMNSFLGLCKVMSAQEGFRVEKKNLSFEEIVHAAQRNLFIIQAELAGSDMTIDEGKVKEIEDITNAIEEELPPIKTFFIPGGTELAALFDVARTFARRAERRVVSVAEEGKVSVGEQTLAYLNRLSSILYALARLSNHKSGITEEPPDYK